jgi:hypothetical protein
LVNEAKPAKMKQKNNCQVRPHWRPPPRAVTNFLSLRVLRSKEIYGFVVIYELALLTLEFVQIGHLFVSLTVRSGLHSVASEFVAAVFLNLQSRLGFDKDLRPPSSVTWHEKAITDVIDAIKYNQPCIPRSAAKTCKPRRFLTVADR